MPELMKGHKWSEHSHKMTYPCFVQVKTDEIRCHVKVHEGVVTYLSYAGKPLHNMQIFDLIFLRLHRDVGLSEFDTGFEVNGNFNDSYRWVRSSRGFPEDLKVESIRFLLFDLPELTMGYYFGEYDRRTQIERAARYCSNHPSIVWATTIAGCPVNLQTPEEHTAFSPEDVQKLYSQMIEQGHEGAMVKSHSHKYQRGKRSYGWLKIKPEEDADGVVQAVHEAVSESGEPLGRAGSISIRMEDGSLASPHGIAHELGRDMFTNPEKYIGQWAEFKYMERDRQGGYRHPRFHRMREAKK
jgi:ATP dependent DNA ligase domain